MRCVCCGKQIIDRAHGPYENDEYYCDKCWNDPCLFFPEKIESVLIDDIETDGTFLNDTILELIDQFREHSINPSSNIKKIWSDVIGNNCIEIPVIKIHQKGNDIFLGKMKAYELLLLSYVEQWVEDGAFNFGYQRLLSKSRSNEIRDYIKNCSIPLIPSLLGSYQEGEYTEINSDVGKLRLPILPGTISLLDGQQRTGGFAALFHEFKDSLQKGHFEQDKELENYYRKLLTFEIPIVLINSKEIVDNLIKSNSKLSDLKPIDIETAFFIIINKTQKGVNASLKDELAYRTILAGIEGIPVIEKERWRTEVVPVANKLCEMGAPLENLINQGGIPGLKKPVQLNGFVTSLKNLYVNNENFKQLPDTDKIIFVSNYWQAIRDKLPFAFEKDSFSEYIITKSIGVYSFNYLASDVFDYCLQNNLDPLEKTNLTNIIVPLEGMDWNVETSPMAYLAGKKGAKHAYELLRDKVFKGV